MPVLVTSMALSSEWLAMLSFALRAVKIRKSSFGPRSRIEGSAPDALDSVIFVTRATPLTEPQAENNVKIGRPQFLACAKALRYQCAAHLCPRIREHLAANLYQPRHASQMISLTPVGARSLSASGNQASSPSPPWHPR